MKRLGKWSFIVLSWASVFLLIATGAIWVRSYFVSDLVFRGEGFDSPNGDREFRLSTIYGGIQFEDFHVSDPKFGTGFHFKPVIEWRYQRDDPKIIAQWSEGYHSDDVSIYPFGWPNFPPDSWWHLPSFETYHDRYVDMVDASIINTWRGVVVPLWMLAILFAVIPSIHVFVMMRRKWRRRSSRKGICRVCGYDLRATPERCPECGTLREMAESGK